MKRIGLLAVGGWLAALSLVAAAQGRLEEPVKVERLSPKLDQLVPKDAVLEKLASGFKWTEGPVWTPGGYLLFAEIPSNRIMKWSPKEGVSTFIEPSGYIGARPYGGPEPGSNGMTLDPKGRLTVAGHARRNVWRLESMTPKGQITVLANSYQGQPFNSPNDLVYNSKGDLYFTDPPYGLRTQSDHDPEKKLKVNGVYRLPGAVDIPAGTTPAKDKLQLLITDLPRPNGIAFSPDEKILYVNNSEPQKIWMRYPVMADGSVGSGKLFFDASSDKRAGAPDGMRLDKNGNLYSTGPGGIWIFSPDGQHLGTIDMPEKAGNLAWGGADGKTMYIMASTSIYRIHLSAEGIKP